MSARKNPPSFVLIEKDSGRVVYTKRATGVGSEAIEACAKRGHELAKKTHRVYTIFLALRTHHVGEILNVPMIYHMGITEEIGPQGSAMPSGRKCCSSPDVRPSGQGMRCFNCQRWESDSYLKNPGRVRRNVFLFNNPPSGPADPTAVHELELYIDNDSQLYHSQFIPIVKNLMLKRRKGVYNRELAVKLFMYLMDSGAKKYVAEFGTRGQKIDSMFNRNTRMQAARAFRDSFETEAELGNYDRLIGPVSNPRPRRKGEKIFICHCGRMISADDADASGAIQCECGRWYNQFGQALKDPSKWSENPRRVRKNVFLFNNPRGGKYGLEGTVERAARAVGLLVTTWSPGDGVTRYRFFVAKPGERYADYHQGGALYTANGRGEAMSFIRSYGIGRGLKNPLTRKESGQELGFARSAMKFAANKQRRGQDATSEFSYAQGIAGVVGRRGTHAAARTAERVMRHVRYNPSPIDPPGLAALDARMNELMRQMDAMKKAKTDNGPEYMILLKEAQAVSKERLKLIGLGGKAIRPNPLLQTVFAANPPISETWNKLSQRQRLELLEIVGVFSGVQTLKSWSSLPESTKELLKQGWFDTTSSGGTTRRRRAVAVNPLTRKEAGGILTRARYDINLGSTFRPGHTRSERAGQAHARAQVVRAYGPIGAGRAAMKIADRAQKLAGTVISNPGVRFPKPGTKLTIAEALAFAEKLGNKELVRQCHAAMKLQKAANKSAKCVIWKVFPMGSSNKIDNVVALTHYGDSPETMYRPPKGSKKGNHLYRHTWGEKGGKPSVPLLASPDGKMLMMPLEGKKVASDWLRH